MNERIAVWLTHRVGSMTTAYLFCALALVSLPSVLVSHNVLVMVSWLAQTFIQLVLLPIIIVGQDVASRRVEATIMETHQQTHALMKAMHAVLTHDAADDALALAVLADVEARDGN